MESSQMFLCEFPPGRNRPAGPTSQEFSYGLFELRAKIDTRPGATRESEVVGSTSMENIGVSPSHGPMEDTMTRAGLVDFMEQH